MTHPAPVLHQSKGAGNPVAQYVLPDQHAAGKLDVAVKPCSGGQTVPTLTFPTTSARSASSTSGSNGFVRWAWRRYVNGISCRENPETNTTGTLYSLNRSTSG